MRDLIAEQLQQHRRRRPLLGSPAWKGGPSRSKLDAATRIVWSVGAMTVSEQTSSRGRSLAEEFIPKRGKMRSISGPTFFSHSVLTFEGRAGDIFANAANSSQIMPPRPRFEGRTHTHRSSKINQFETKAQSSLCDRAPPYLRPR